MAGLLSRLFGNAGVPVTSPFTEILWPDQKLELIAGDRVRSIPAVERCLGVIAGTIKQLPMDDYKGAEPQPRPEILKQPDPNHARSWLVEQAVTDYLLHGNSILYVTLRNARGFPAVLQWIPAVQVTIAMTGLRYPDDVEYWHGGTKLERANVIHVQRGADDWWPARGVGVIEQHLRTFSRVYGESDYEAKTLASGAVPSIAVITPNAKLSQEEADAAKKQWLSKFAGKREPVILPANTQVIPLAWSPTDADLTEARKLSLQDTANIFNLDGYWVGAPTSSLTYRAPGQLYHIMMRTTIEPILSDFEGQWSPALLPSGHMIRFDRKQTEFSDLATSVATLQAAVQSGIMTISEARRFLALPLDPEITATSPVETVNESGEES